MADSESRETVPVSSCRCRISTAYQKPGHKKIIRPLSTKFPVILRDEFPVGPVDLHIHTRPVASRTRCR